ncbi:MAG: hypothetical protein HYR75_05195, partial [Gemmatimonadetes bacterium]|nr:hypothetical protein [Gemmatimonadota bacterium]
MAPTRTIALGIGAAAVLGAAAAIRLRPDDSSAAGDDASRAPVTVRWHESDTLDAGEPLAKLLQRHHLSRDDATAVLAAATALDDRHVPAGLVVDVDGNRRLGIASPAAAVTLHLSPDRLLHFTRQGTKWVAEDERITWTVDTVVARGVVHHNLYEAVDEGAGALLPAKSARAELAWAIADVYEYRIDMSRELQDGDRVRVVFERGRSPKGGVRVGDVIAAGVERNGRELQAYRY